MIGRRDDKTARVFTRRALLVLGGQTAALGLLGARLYQVQVLDGAKYATLAQENRISARLLAPRFIEVHVDSDAATCAGHDPHGLYGSAARAQLPGAGAPYEPPPSPDVIAHGGNDDAAARAIAARVLAG